MENREKEKAQEKEIENHFKSANDSHSDSGLNFSEQIPQAAPHFETSSQKDKIEIPPACENSNTRDIFDKIMSLPGLRIFEPFYKKYKSALLYLFFGGLAFFLNFFLFVAIDKFTPLGVFANNAICWTVCVLFQFFTNRTWVFDGRVETAAGFARQMASFFAGRLFTLFAEFAILAIFITWLSLPRIPVKLFAQVVVIVLNYIISKLFVFKKK